VGFVDGQTAAKMAAGDPDLERRRLRPVQIDTSLYE
jgi:hypothetical protein